MINFTRAFDTAWERMVIILFRPFDPGKWFIIGLGAFLAGLLQGGNGFNSGSSFNNLNDLNNPDAKNQLPKFNAHELNSSISHLFAGMQLGFIIVLTVVILFFVFAIVLLMYWLGSRGQFLLLDNIVRNRASVGWPWERYARQANSFFGMYVLIVAVSFAVLLPILIVAIVMSVPLLQQNRWPVGGEIIGFVILGCAYMAVAIVLSFILFIFREFGAPLMFRNGLMARAAFMEVMRLVGQNPGNMALFVLLRLALGIAVGIVSVMTCCLCCIGAFPYIGTVVLLPALIYVRCFTLDCLAQFGPQYDVFTVDVAPTSFSPPPLHV